MIIIIFKIMIVMVMIIMMIIVVIIMMANKLMQIDIADVRGRVIRTSCLKQAAGTTFSLSSPANFIQHFSLKLQGCESDGSLYYSMQFEREFFG